MGLERLLGLSIIFGACSEYELAEKKEEKAPIEEYTPPPAQEEPCVYTDHFIVSNNSCVDIIAVVDTSGSMYSGTDEIVGVKAFLDYFTKTRFPEYANPMMVVIDGETNRYLNTPITIEDAQTTIWTLEEVSRSREMLLDALIKYTASTYGLWVRKECSLSIAMFSDEDDQSYDYATSADGDESAVEQFIDELTSIVDDEETKEIYFTAVVNPSLEQLCPASSEGDLIGYRFEQIKAYYSGGIHDICSSYKEWTIPMIAPQEFGWPLTYTPKENTFVVYIGGELSTDSCTYEDGTVYYPNQEYLDEGTKVNITYEIDITKYEGNCPVE